MASATATPTWLSERRESAASLVEGLSLPGPKDRGWEFTDLSDLDLGSYRAGATLDGPVPALPAAGDRTTVPGTPDPLADSLRLVQSGTGLEVSATEVSGNGKPDGPVVMPLDEAATRFGDLVAAHLGTVVSAENDIFVAQNEATWAGGAFVYVPAGTTLEQPVELVTVQEDSGSALIWRNLVIVEEGASAEVWETHRSAHRGDALFNGVTEIRVGAGANLRFVCGQGLSEKSWAFATQRAEVERDASLEWIALGFGSARGKVRMETKLAGPGSHAKVTGAYAGGGSQHLDYDTTQEHAADHTTSDLAFRGVLTDRATAVWRGMIRVDPEAQQTDAFQESRNLLLSPNAHADAIPGLEIEADDVRCTHAAAIAQVDAEQLFYLQSRGVPEETAKRLIVEGFLQELVERAPKGPMRELLTDSLDRRLTALLAP